MAPYFLLSISFNNLDGPDEADAAIRESEARFRTLADAVPQVIWANEAGGRATYFNGCWYAIAMSGFGMGADQLRSKEAGFRHHLLKPVDPNQLDAVLEEAARELSAAP